MGRRECRGWRLLNAWIRKGAFPHRDKYKDFIEASPTESAAITRWPPVPAEGQPLAPPPLTPRRLGVLCFSGPPASLPGVL